MNILHDSIMSQEDTLLKVDFTNDKWYDKLWKGYKWVCEMIGAFIGFDVTDSSKGKMQIDSYEKDDYPDVLYLPLYSLTPEEIFKGNILLFDVDFFNPKEVYVRNTGHSDPSSYELTDAGRKYKNSEFPQMTDEQAVSQICIRHDMYDDDTSGLNEQGKKDHDALMINDSDFLKYVSETKRTKVSDVPKEDLEGKDVEYYYIDGNGKEVKTSNQNTASALSTTISKWYNAIRNIALVLMLSILLYIGIRMLISSVSTDKAKYKQMLMDWLVGMCLLFFLHYIMAFSVTLTNKLTDIVKSVDDGGYAVHFKDDDDKIFSNGLQQAGLGDCVDGSDIYYSTNIMGRIRIAAEMCHGRVRFIGFAICFLVLVFYTVFFSFIYLRRVIYLAFLTIIAPFVAMTYPIDKVNDGQAQGFNKWLKEYIFNLLLQPMHLILYTMLVSSVFDFASVNVWYMLVAIGFLIPGEKLLRSLFGFEKATTPGSFAGAAVGAGLISNGVGKLLSKMPTGSSKQKIRDSKNKELNSGKDDGKSPRMNFDEEDFDAAAAIMGGTGLIAATRDNPKKSEDNDDSKEKEKIALNKYRQEGFKKNVNGEYFNPYTNEYDKDYDPRKDENYLGDSINLQQNMPKGENVKLNVPKNNNSKLNVPKNNNSKLNAPKSNRPDMPSNDNSRLNIPKRNMNNRLNIPKSRKISKSRSIGRALKTGVRRTFTGPKVRRVLTNVGKTGIRMATGATLGAVAGTIGVAAGIASGNLSNAFQFGTAGIGAGAVSGARLADASMNTIGNTISNTRDKIKNSETRKAMSEAYYGEEEYRKRQRDKQIKEWKKNLEYKEQLEKVVGQEGANQMYEKGEIDEYLKHGISQIEDIAAMHQLQENHIADNTDEAVAIHEYGERIGGDYKSLKSKDKKDWKDTFSEEFQQRGHSKENSDKASEKTFDKIREYHDIRKSIKMKL